MHSWHTVHIVEQASYAPSHIVGVAEEDGERGLPQHEYSKAMNTSPMTNRERKTIAMRRARELAVMAFEE